jgi:hypothetical protein
MILEIGIAISGVAIFIFFPTRLFSFYYLEISNNYDKYPFTRLNLEFLTYYNKNVKTKDEIVKKICNVSLIVSGYSFAMLVVFTIIMDFVK